MMHDAMAIFFILIILFHDSDSIITHFFSFLKSLLRNFLQSGSERLDRSEYNRGRFDFVYHCPFCDFYHFPEKIELFAYSIFFGSSDRAEIRIIFKKNFQNPFRFCKVGPKNT